MVETLLGEAEVIDIIDALKLLAANRAIEKRAPFHRQRKSTGRGQRVCANFVKKIFDWLRMHRTGIMEAIDA